MAIKDRLKLDPEKERREIERFIRDACDLFGKDGAVIGLSGGIDSSLASILTAEAIGPERVKGIIMPERESSPKSEEDALKLAEKIGIATEKVDITPILNCVGLYKHIPKPVFANRKVGAFITKTGFEIFSKMRGKDPFIEGLKGTDSLLLKRVNTYYRLKHRIRMVILYTYADRENRLVVGTSNKTEYLTGFFVKYGDGASDIMPLLHLYKTQVKELAKYMGVPDEIIKKPPSPDLLPGIEDEMALGMSYNKLDLILAGMEEGLGDEEIEREAGVRRGDIERVREMVRSSEYMRSWPLDLKGGR